MKPGSVRNLARPLGVPTTAQSSALLGCEGSHYASRSRGFRAATTCTARHAAMRTCVRPPTRSYRLYMSFAAAPVLTHRRHARRARVLLADGSTAAAARKLAVQHDCTACPLTRQPVCSESGLELQNACLARCQGIIATEERCHGRSSINARVSGTAAQRRRQQGSAAIVDDAATRLTESEFSVGKSSMQRFRGEGFVMIAVRPPSDFGSGAKPAVSDRRFMQEGRWAWQRTCVLIFTGQVARE